MSEIYTLKKENLEIQNSWRNDLKELNKRIMNLKIDIIRNDQYINRIVDPSVRKLNEFEKNLYELEKEVEIINVKNKSSYTRK